MCSTTSSCAVRTRQRENKQMTRDGCEQLRVLVQHPSFVLELPTSLPMSSEENDGTLASPPPPLPPASTARRAISLRVGGVMSSIPPGDVPLQPKTCKFSSFRVFDFIS